MPDLDYRFSVVLTKEKLAALRKAATAQGIIATQHGVIEQHGVKVEYSIDDNYHPQDGSTTVNFTILQKSGLSRFISDSTIEERIEEYIDELPTVPDPTVTHVVAGDPNAGNEQVDEQVEEHSEQDPDGSSVPSSDGSSEPPEPPSELQGAGQTDDIPEDPPTSPSKPRPKKK